MKVMLVDDSRTIRNIQRNVLAQLGHSVIVEAGDGVEALALLEKEPMDLVLVDWHMPRMDGVNFVRKLRATDKVTPVVICTTEADKEQVVEAIKAGATQYLVKPFDAEALAKKIDQAMARAHA